MTTQVAKMDNDYDTILKAIGDRRAAVMDAIRQYHPGMRHEEARKDALEAAQEEVYRGLFDRGERKPIGADYVAWLVDQELWSRFQRNLGRPFLSQYERRPSPRYGPSSGRFA
jgi:hypothetical protein